MSHLQQAAIQVTPLNNCGNYERKPWWFSPSVGGSVPRV